MSRMLGVFGGTFDPIHLGHLRAAESARESLGLDLVTFVPAGTPPHRPQPVSSSRDRYAMVALATSGHPQFDVSDVELEREGPSFTVDTLKALQDAHTEDRLVLIVGSDTLPEMGSWKDPELLQSRCTIAVVGRPPLEEQPKGAAHGAQPAPVELAVTRVDGPQLPLSATAIRRQVREGRSIRYLVPEAVAEYIQKRGLYR